MHTLTNSMTLGMKAISLFLILLVSCYSTGFFVILQPMSIKRLSFIFIELSLASYYNEVHLHISNSLSLHVPYYPEVKTYLFQSIYGSLCLPDLNILF